MVRPNSILALGAVDERRITITLTASFRIYELENGSELMCNLSTHSVRPTD
jgi:hypothetical protein